MAWTATLLSAVDRDSFWKIVVEYTDGVRTVERAYQFNGATANELRAFVRAQALTLEKIDPVDLNPFVGQSVDVTPPVITPPDPPTQAEIDRDAWFVDYQQLNRLLEVTTKVPALLTAQTQTLIDNLRTSLEAGWINSYLDGI